MSSTSGSMQKEKTSPGRKRHHSGSRHGSERSGHRHRSSGHSGHHGNHLKE
jgi:hypothetical protein